jgi:hypothetical protein
VPYAEALNDELCRMEGRAPVADVARR